jgi:hypothetical protein
MHTDSYINELRRTVAEKRAARAATEATAAAMGDPRAALRERIRLWLAAHPTPARAPHYFMEELTKLFNAPQQDLGLALREVGWQYRRCWPAAGPNRRQWIPPSTEQQE